tara:strand:- start:1887 stop:2120 length:234 start_codon:yes stop_codon:yes gene_type:complete
VDLTDAQKASLATLKEKIQQWKTEKLRSIDDEFQFLTSIRLRDSSLSTLISADAVNQAVAEIDQIQELLSGAYLENA